MHNPIRESAPIATREAASEAGLRAPGNELDGLYVRIEQLASVLQEKYGLSRSEAMRKVAALKHAFREDT